MTGDRPTPSHLPAWRRVQRCECDCCGRAASRVALRAAAGKHRKLLIGRWPLRKEWVFHEGIVGSQGERLGRGRTRISLNPTQSSHHRASRVTSFLPYPPLVSNFLPSFSFSFPRNFPFFPLLPSFLLTSLLSRVLTCSKTGAQR